LQGKRSFESNSHRGRRARAGCGAAGSVGTGGRRRGKSEDRQLGNGEKRRRPPLAAPCAPGRRAPDPPSSAARREYAIRRLGTGSAWSGSGVITGCQCSNNAHVVMWGASGETIVDSRIQIVRSLDPARSSEGTELAGRGGSGGGHPASASVRFRHAGMPEELVRAPKLDLFGSAAS
jgi:hypothetical protein